MLKNHLVKKKRATSYDVARAAGVSQPTVSRCLKGDAAISAETRERVLRIATELGYARNALARSLITQRSHMVSVITTEFTLHNNPGLIYALGDALRRTGIGLILQTIENDSTIGTVLQQTLEYPLDGLICCAEMGPGDLARFTAHGLPIVFFNRAVEAPKIDYVTLDHAAASRRLAAGFHRAGHRDIVCIAGPENAPVSSLRVTAFVDELARRGLSSKVAQTPDFSYAGGKAAFAQLVAGRSRPDAVFCANDQLALGVIDACRFDLGWRVPDDISVTGFDDIEEAARPAYELTTVRQPIVAMATRAVELLLDRIADPDAPARRLLVPGEIMHRHSARLVAEGPDPA